MSDKHSHSQKREEFQKTGAIWGKPVRTRQRIVSGVCDALEAGYGRPRLGNPEDPLDDLLYIMMSNKTSPEMAQNVYSQTKRRFHDWDILLGAPEEELYSILKPAGLAGVKSSQIRRAVSQVREDFGDYTFRDLRQRPEPEVQEYLVSLPGVSEKVAKCVMMYTMDSGVLPVDSHVHRIARRLGWTTRKRADQCHAELEALVPPERRYVFHVGCIVHGRSVCRSRGPQCQECCISEYCDSREVVNQGA